MSRRRRLNAYVHVDGVAYGPDDTVPAEVAARIGEHAWAKSTDDVDLPDGGDGGEADVPPRSGRGSGRDAWAAFAQSHGLDVGEDRTREQIIADLEEGGVIEREE